MFSLAVSLGLLIALASTHRTRDVGRPDSASAPGGDGLQPGEYTYEEALAASLTTRAQWGRPRGMRRCPPIPNPYPSVPANAPVRAGAPTCYMPPEELGLVFVVEPKSVTTPYGGGLGQTPYPARHPAGPPVTQSSTRWFNGPSYAAFAASAGR